MNKIRIGVLSTANIARRSIIPGIIALPNHFQLVGIASRDQSKAKAIASQFQTNEFDSYDTLIDPLLIDAIYIPLPNALHYYWVKKSLQRGIHVLVEKSLACTLTEVEELISIARKKRLVLVENFQFRFHRQLKEIYRLIQNGVLGEIRSLRASFGFPPFKDSENIRYKNSLGGGALLDAGAYTVKICQLLLGYGLKVKAATLNNNLKNEVDIWGGAFLQHPDTDQFASVAFGFDNYYQCGIELWGSKGKLSTNRLFTSPPGHEPVLILETHAKTDEIKIVADNHFENMLLHFYSLISTLVGLDEEYIQNLDQSRLLTEIITLSNDK